MAFESLLKGLSPNRGSLVSNSVGSVFLDAVTREQHTSKLRITENPIESGANIADHAVLEPKEVTVTGVVVGYTPHNSYVSSITNNSTILDYALPVDVKAITEQAELKVKQMAGMFQKVTKESNPVIADFLPSMTDFGFSSADRIKTALEKLEELQRSGELVTLHTNLKSYKNMAIISIQTGQSTQMTGEFSIVLREVFIVETKIGSGLKSPRGESDKVHNLGRTQPKESRAVLHVATGLSLGG